MAVLLFSCKKYGGGRCFLRSKGGEGGRWSSLFSLKKNREVATSPFSSLERKEQWPTQDTRGMPTSLPLLLERERDNGHILPYLNGKGEWLPPSSPLSPLRGEQGGGGHPCSHLRKGRRWPMSLSRRKEGAEGGGHSPILLF